MEPDVNENEGRCFNMTRYHSEKCSCLKNCYVVVLSNNVPKEKSTSENWYLLEKKSRLDRVRICGIEPDVRVLRIGPVDMKVQTGCCLVTWL